MAFKKPTTKIINGNSLEELPKLPDNSIDAIVTDPPYELGFMGKKWDGSGIAYNVELWAECLRVLKPGGHLLAFGGTRTYHRMAVAIEDAGFEIRDSVHWVYGSGFPKSHDVSKAIDKRGGSPHLATQIGLAIKQAREARGWSVTKADKHFCGGTTNWSWFEGRPAGQRPPTVADFALIAAEWPELAPLAEMVAEAEREVVGTKKSSLGGTVAAGERDPEFITKHKNLDFDITAPATDAAREWSGWGTALKPAHEPIVVARKPLVGTVAGNVLAYGTGALNIDGCRVGFASEADEQESKAKNQHADFGTKPGNNNVYGDYSMVPAKNYNPPGRWPANLVFTHAADCGDECVAGCPVAELDGQSGDRPGMKPGVLRRGATTGTSIGGGAALGNAAPQDAITGYADSGGASRFFTVTEWDPTADVAPFRYVAKPSKRERNAGLDGLPEEMPLAPNGSPNAVGATRGSRSGPRQNFHPTVKPVALMRWLVRLVTPPGGTVLDPFAGSGTTLVAATLEGFDSIGIEMTDDYLPIIDGRITWAEQQIENTLDLGDAGGG